MSDHDDVPADPNVLIARMASLADPARLRVLHLLAEQPMPVNDLADVLQLPQSTVSRHLKTLSEQGWLVSNRAGTSHQYQMLQDELDPTARPLWEVARQQSAQWTAVSQDRLRLASVLAARARDSRTFFADAARDWDALRDEFFGGRFTAEALLALIDPDSVIADLGCGTGTLVAALAGHVTRVIGIDNSDQMLDAARRRVAGMANVTLQQGDLTSLPLPDASIDLTVCVLSLSYAVDLPAALAEARRITRQRLIVVDVLAHHRDDFRRQMGQVRMGFAQEEFSSALKIAGFTTITFR
ncbi:MAG TPA: metalloregulator ArsR/SmtB family transcription factor, partial [Tepidisphaeraceae bacterium]